MVLAFDMTQVDTYSQSELSRFVTEQNIDALVTGRRTRQNLMDALRLHHSTIGPVIEPLVFDIDEINSYSKTQLQVFCVQFNSVPPGTNPNKESFNTYKHITIVYLAQIPSRNINTLQHNNQHDVRYDRKHNTR